MKNMLEFFIKYRALIGIILLLVLLYLAEPSATSITIGFFLIIAGTAFRGWTAGFLNKDTELATKGPYTLTRNPLYFANFILGLGIAVSGNTIYTYAIFVFYYFTFFPFLMAIEHHRLKKQFGEKYDEWAKKSNVFLPKIKKVDSSFNISLYMKNREYRLLFYSLFVIAVLIFQYIRLTRAS